MILFVTLLVVFLLNILYWAFFLVFFPKNFKKDIKRLPNEFISIIVVFKNECENLEQLIPILLAQDYANYEIILMDDFSIDDSAALIKKFTSSKIRLLRAVHNKIGKKHALYQAIDVAKGKFLLFTDADCMPNSDQWISQMANNANKKSQIVLGYGPMIYKKGLLNRFQRFETLLTALQYCTYAHIGIPYMGVGRNLLYQKSLYHEKKSKIKATHLASGDDDLNIMAMANNKNVAFSLNPASFCYSESKSSVIKFLQQKTRHTSTAFYYKPHHQILLGIFAMSQIGFYAIWFLTFILNSSYWYSLICIFIIKIIFGIFALKKLDGQNLMIHFVYLDFLLACYYLILAPLSLLKKGRNW